MNIYLRKTATAVIVSSMLLSAAGCVVGGRSYDYGDGERHNWNRHEETTFRIYLSGRHEPYREFRNLNRDEQGEYWRWRHDHPDGNSR